MLRTRTTTVRSGLKQLPSVGHNLKQTKMKLILLITILLFSGIKSHASGLKTFVPKENGYVLVEIKVELESINNIVKFLGYNSEEFYTYFHFDLKY